jgi:glycosyltransferase involved in cell wall biosynthesis
MRILHVTPYYAPAWAFGGVCRAVAGLARAQVQAGHIVSVLTSDALSPRSRIRCLQEVLDGVQVIRVPNLAMVLRRTLNLSSPAGYGRALAHLQATCESSIVHCHELRTVETLEAARIGAARPAPLVLSPHGTLPLSTGRRWAKRLWDGLSARSVLPRFAEVIALTEGERAEALALWARHGVPLAADRISVVPNGIDPALFTEVPPRAEARRRLTAGQGPVVLFLGRLSPRKGLSLLLAAFAAVVPRMPTARLIVAGPDEGAGDALAAEVRRLALGAHVLTTGMLSDEDRLAALGAADLFALPAVGEGFSMAALEALACGVPVLLSPECGFPRAEEAGAGLTVVRTVEAWAPALESLLMDEGRRRDMGARGRALVQEEYTWTRIAPQVQLAYDRAEAAVRRRRASEHTMPGEDSSGGRR